MLFRRLAQLFVGLWLYGLGIALIVRAGLGNSPWDVLAQGLTNLSGLSFGTITVLVSIVVLLFWIPIRQRIGFGTVMNALLVGPSADFWFWVLPTDLELWSQIVFLGGGILVLGGATGLYIGAGYGPGPRDGLMTGLHRVTGQKIWVVRTALEATVLIIGWVLGGTVGLGTVAFTLLIGPVCGVTIPLFTITSTRADAAPRAHQEATP